MAQQIHSNDKMSAKFQPNQETFSKHYNDEKSQLVYSWIPADLTTPVSAYLKLCANEKYAFLLESVEGGNVLGRYSIIGFKPDKIWSSTYETVNLWNDYGSWEKCNKAVIPSLEEMIAECAIDIEPSDVPPMAVSGLFGYMSYDMVRHVEKIPDDNGDSIGVADSIMMRPSYLVIFDNVKNMMCIVKPIYTHAGINSKNAGDLYQESSKELGQIIERLSKGLDYTPADTALSTPLEVTSNTTKDEYCGMVEKAVEYIRAGDIFQVVPSQRFSVPFDLPSFELYRSLRRENPSPFLFHFQFDNFSLIGSSPEILVRVRDKEVTIRPIAGTRKRGKDAAEDKALAEDLLSDPKERAEHLMLLDLGRNDVGRVAEIGSVKVTDQFIVEYYSHVMHIVSNVIGTIKPDVSILEALFSGFPAGTVSGAPKIRAMEIIDELEKERRSFYAGCAGYISGNGNMDTCIALRTGLLKDGTLYVQAGAGVVADSKPESEYEETCNKAKALIRAAEIAIDLHSKDGQN